MNKIEAQIKSIRNEEEPYVGMPLYGFGRNMDCRPDPCRRERREADRCLPDQRNVDALAGLPLAMAYVPWQQWNETYEPEEGWHRGTIFPELDLPFLGGGTR